MQNEKLQITLTEGNELHIREGKLPDMLPVKEQKIISLSGDIKTISNFVTPRLLHAIGMQVIDIKKTVVIVDKAKKTIFMALDPENYYGTTVTGSLEESDELKEFGINSTKQYDRKSLHKLIKFSKGYFEDTEQHANLIDALNSIKFKTETVVEQSKSNQGNSRDLKEKNIVDNMNFPAKFTLSVPAFKGFDKIKVEVEICYETSDISGGVLFWLESPELVEYTNRQLDSIFASELSCLEGFVIINK